MKTFSLFVIFVFIFTTAYAAYGDVVNVFFKSGDALYGAIREVSVLSPQTALSELMAGPNKTEIEKGVTTRIPGTWVIESINEKDNYIIINLGGIPAGTNYPDDVLDDAISQFSRTINQFGYNAKLVVNGESISILRIPSVDPGHRPIIASIKSFTTSTGVLAGKKICVSPGHGYMWNGSSWVLQRPVCCAPLAEEDLHNIDNATYLIKYLEADGATVINVRETDKNRGNNTWGLPWWKMSAPPYLWDKGYPSSVYAPLTGVDPGTSGVDQTLEDRRSRPLACNYDNGDLYLSIHTNALNGDCTGTGCRTGMEMFYDTTKEGSNGSASQSLAAACMSNALSTINTNYGSFGCSRGCAPIDNEYAEIHYPAAPACLFEMAYHDSCDTDATYLRDPLFTSASMYGIYKGICQYYGLTPTYNPYSAEYVSDDIPDTVDQNEIRTVHITFRNRGLAWTEAHQFRLGAVDNSDPFTDETRQLISGTVGPGDTYTFTFVIHFPMPGVQTTNWRMVRDGVTWFGDTLTKNVLVNATVDDTIPPTAPGNLQTNCSDCSTIHLTWEASTDNIGVLSYEIWRNGQLLKTLLSPAVSYDDTGFNPNTSCTYQVRAMDGSNNYSEFSNTASDTTWSIIAQDDFSNLNEWTSGRSIDGTINGVTLDTTIGNTLTGGSGAPSAEAIPGSTTNSGAYSYMGFSKPFAVAFVQCAFKDTSTYNSSRQGLFLRKFQNDDETLPILAYFIGTDYAANYGYYHTEIYSASNGWTKNKNAGGARSIAWHVFKMLIDGTSAKFYVDDTLKTTASLPAEALEGSNRIYIGNEYSVKQKGWYDDLLACAPTPPVPSMTSPTINQNSITWNYVEGDKDYEQGFYVKDTEGNLKATGTRNSTSTTESGLVANTSYTRSVSAYNGTLESTSSTPITAVTLSIPPAADNITVVPSIGGWTSGSISLVSKSVFGSGGVAYYKYILDQNKTYSFSGTESVWNSGTLTLDAPADGIWYIHIAGYNSADVVNGQLDLGPFICDTAPLTASISDIKSLPAQSVRQLTGKTVVAAFADRLYIEETNRSSAIAVIPSEETASVGDLIDIIGPISGVDTERFIIASYLHIMGSTIPPDPVYIGLKYIGGSSFGLSPGALNGIGLYNVGLLAAVSGIVTDSDNVNGTFIICDGSAIISVRASGMIIPQSGFARIVGIIRLDSSFTPYIQPRSQADIYQIP